jgi:hypothetical protein
MASISNTKAPLECREISSWFFYENELIYVKLMYDSCKIPTLQRVVIMQQ